MATRRALAALAVGALLALAAGLGAQNLDFESFESRATGLGEDADALRALQLLYEDQFIKAREAAEAILRRDPRSYAGHFVLGSVLHHPEGNLPVARFHLETAQKRFEERWGEAPGHDAPWTWHAQILIELAYVHGEMGRHEHKLAYLDAYNALYEPRRPADRGWPLMRLRRYDEARAAIAEGLLLQDQPDQVATAKTALCAVEAEQQRRRAAYEACLAAAAFDRSWPTAGPTTFTNAAEAALGMLKMDEAERLILEGTERPSRGTVSNPWLSLTLLYLAEGRTAEALDTVREMFEWRSRQPPSIDEQTRADTEITSAIFLVVAGRPVEAARITRRALEQPDRTGFTSAESEQMEAASALLDHLANRAAAELKEEEAASSPFWRSFGPRLEAARHRLRAWSSGRRFTALVADDRLLHATLRPYLAGGIEIPEWVEPELVGVLGPGVAAAALEEARRRETLAEAEGYFEAFAAEIALRQGRERQALRHAERAVATLPAAEHLLLARVWGVAGQAALAAGERRRALESFDRAFQLDPGVVRRLGIALPAAFSAGGGPVASALRGHLRRSPRFEAASGGFRVRIETASDSAGACLHGPGEATLGCARLTRREGEPADAFASRLARHFHAEVFAPRLDLTQADLRSLDGSPTAGGGRSRRQLRSVLDQVVEEGGG